MKKLLFIALLAFSMSAKAQITLEHKYDSASDNNSNILMIVKFEVLGEQYVKINRQGNNISIYDLNHSLTKTISFANYPPHQGNYVVLYLSQHLFNDDDKIEFLYMYSDSQGDHTRIYNEDGTIIFNADSLYPWCEIHAPQEQLPIYNTAQGTKMILSHMNGQAWVYSLPGTLTVDIAQANNQLLNSSSLKLSNPYPNPNKNSTTIDYTLPDGINTGEIVFYNLQGAEVKRFKVDRTFNNLLISTADIAAGTYYYQLQTNKENSGGRKMVVIR